MPQPLTDYFLTGQPERYDPRNITGLFGTYQLLEAIRNSELAKQAYAALLGNLSRPTTFAPPPAGMQPVYLTTDAPPATKTIIAPQQNVLDALQNPVQIGTNLPMPVNAQQTAPPQVDIIQPQTATPAQVVAETATTEPPHYYPETPDSVTALQPTPVVAGPEAPVQPWQQVSDYMPLQEQTAALPVSAQVQTAPQQQRQTIESQLIDLLSRQQQPKRNTWMDVLGAVAAANSGPNVIMPKAAYGGSVSELARNEMALAQMKQQAGAQNAAIQNAARQESMRRQALAQQQQQQQQQYALDVLKAQALQSYQQQQLEAQRENAVETRGLRADTQRATEAIARERLENEKQRIEALRAKEARTNAEQIASSWIDALESGVADPNETSKITSALSAYPDLKQSVVVTASSVKRTQLENDRFYDNMSANLNSMHSRFKTDIDKLEQKKPWLSKNETDQEFAARKADMVAQKKREMMADAVRLYGKDAAELTIDENLNWKRADLTGGTQSAIPQDFKLEVAREAERLLQESVGAGKPISQDEAIAAADQLVTLRRNQQGLPQKSQAGLWQQLLMTPPPQ